MKKGERKQFCKRGHDTFICGRYSSGHCNLCYPHKPLEKARFCPKGHDKDIVGKYPNGHCKKCKQEYTKNYQKELKSKKRKIIHTKQFCVNGHDTLIVGRDITGHCNVCGKIYDSKKDKKYKKENGAKIFNNHLKRKYGITLEDYNKMFKKQKGKCVGCQRSSEEFKNPLGVDHNHKTKEVRGLLCMPCNMLLGLAKDNINTLKRLAKYLQEYSK